MCLLLGADMCLTYCCTCTTDFDLIKIQLLCPFLSVFLIPQISSWLLKGRGNCSIKLFSSDSLSSSHGVIYTEHDVIVFMWAPDIATTYMFVFRVISL